ncbi:TonB-dependent receptor domain-containing protein [Pseudoalteromonas denitrificans]|uniref:Iron complex outermembrane recepter protein n=1 Tax=Pseudoalteromonas denitrificans DSM 6059 TaxID=1123010 RepID=A0A1I1N5Z3_9GAMM|nr:TonB-dependent receptor [Pseudoalteromonas denitrificans]SFC90213.1 iron complex outermembrane recepter protein [Pseudoalteromonas denitrificans DSM 6059]
MILFPAYIFLASSIIEPQDLKLIERIQVNANRNLLHSQTLSSGRTDLVFSDEKLSLNRSISDWLVQIPGLSLNGQGGLMQSYSLRGLSRSRIRTEVDGIPIITDRRAGNSISFIPPELFSSVSVQKGPSSTIFGSEAMGGVIALSTITPESLNLSINQQTNGDQTSLAMSYGSEKIKTGLVYRNSENSLAANNKELNTQFKQTAGLIKYQDSLNKYDFILSFLASNTQDIGKSSELFPDKRITVYPEEFHSLSQFQLSYQKDWLIKFYHHYQNWDSEVKRINSRTNLTAYQANTLGSLFYQSHQFLSGEGRMGVEWVARRGVNISEQELDQNSHLNFSHTLLDGKQDNIGFFIDDHWQVDQVNLMAAIRYDTISQKNTYQKSTRHGDKLNTSFAATWQISDTLKLHSEYGTGFRFPTLSELYFNGETPRGSTLGNTHLAPETSKGASLDLYYQNDISKLTLSGYVQNLDNYIERYRINSDLRSYRNIEQAKIHGIELSYEFQLNDYLSHQLSYQWQQGENKNNETLSDLNPSQWHFRSTLALDNASFHNHFSYRETYSDFGDGEEQLNSAFIWNLKWQYQLDSHLDLSIYTNNLLDKLYYGSADEDADFQPGRTIGIELKYQF